MGRHGVIPITADQDTPGPMAKTVADAALLLGALEGARPDLNDSAARACTPAANNDYSSFLGPDGQRSARIGIPTAFFYERVTPPRTPQPGAG